MSEISESTKNLIDKYSFWQKSLKPSDSTPTIHVDEVASKVAAFYEQIRTIIDWKEEHLMRRAAIIRKLKGRFLDLELNSFSSDNIAEPLVLELIRGGYFPNDRIEESKIQDVQKIINKYVFILKHSPENKKGKVGIQFYTKLLEIAACEIEETLAPSIKEMALMDYMFEMMKARIKVNEAIYEKNILKREPAHNAFGIPTSNAERSSVGWADAGGEKDIQIYIAVQQSLFKLDAPIISYNLIKYKYPQWDKPSEEELFKISQNIFKILQIIEKDLSCPIARKFYYVCEKYDTPYLLLGDILSKDDIEKIAKEIQDPSLMEAKVQNAYVKRLKDLKAKIKRAAIYSTTSIFITKVLSLILLEIILAKIFKGHINITALSVDILLPTFLMIFLVTTIKPPSKKNLQLVILETMKIVYKKDKIDIYEIKLNRKRGLSTKFFLSLIYLVGACITFGFIYWIFNYFKFPITSILIDTIFIALILFAGKAIKTRSQELTIEEEPGGFLGFMSDILLLPITGMGRWMSNTWKQYNAIAAFFNALIDMPFSSFVEFVEGWRYFIKEKKEEMR